MVEWLQYLLLAGKKSWQSRFQRLVGTVVSFSCRVFACSKSEAGNALVAGKISDSIVSLKKEVVGFLSQNMAASNLADDEGTVLTVHGPSLPRRMLRFYIVAVNMLEEVVSDAEEAPKKTKAGGQKRKR